MFLPPSREEPGTSTFDPTPSFPDSEWVPSCPWTGERRPGTTPRSPRTTTSVVVPGRDTTRRSPDPNWTSGGRKGVGPLNGVKGTNYKDPTRTLCEGVGPFFL